MLFSSSLEALTNCSDQTQIPESECQALVALYNDTQGSNWNDSPDNDWNVTNEPCSWQGVKCRDNSVVKISLVNKNLNGTLPDLSTLTQLKVLLLDDNQLIGHLPEFGFRHPLQRLNLENNQFVGKVPASFSQLNSLSSLELGYNKLMVNMEDISFLNLENFDWIKTQTIPPTLVEASALSPNSLRLDWIPIPYTGDGGYYQIECGTRSGGPYSITTKTVDKSVYFQIVNELLPATRYYCVVKTFTPAHGKQHNELISELSEEVSVVTLEKVLQISLESKCAIQKDISPTECEQQVSSVDHTEDGSSEENDSYESDEIEVISSGTFDSSKVVDAGRYYLTVNKTGLGSIQGKNIHCGIDCSQSYVSGTFVTLTATPAEGYSFAGWSDDCDTSGQVWMTSDQTCTATFDRQRSSDEVSKALSMVSETRIDLGSGMIGQPVEKTLIVAETGVVPVEVSQATLSGPDAGYFSLVSGEPPFIIPAEGPAHSLTVQCIPEMAGIYEATLTLTTDNESEPTIDYLLVCEGFDETTLSYGSNPLPGETLNFESVVGLPSVATIEIFEERGMSGLEISDSYFNGEHANNFSIANGTSSFTIPEEGSYTLMVRCLPDKPGVHQAELILTTNDSYQSTINYSLNCIGLAAGYGSNPSPDDLIFVGSSSVEDTVITQLVIEETGTVTLDVTDSSLSGTHAGDFDLTHGAPFSIADGGESHTVTISCTPSATGERTATLHFATNDPQHPNVSYPLACTGTTLSSTNQPPTDIQLSNEIIAKNSGIGTLIGTLVTVDLDMDDAHFYTLDNDAGGRFKIVDNQLQVAMAPLSEDTPYLITVTATDQAGSSISKDFTLRFDDTNLRPTNIILSNNNVSENSVPGTRVGFLSTLDPNTDDEHHYVLDNSAEGRFKIVGNQLQVAEKLPDLETKSGYLVTITSIDSGDLSFTKDFSLEVVQNESPTNIMLSDNIVGLDNVVGTVVGVLSTVDSDDSYHTYALYNNAGGRFKVVGNELQVATDSLNTAGHYLIIVITTDRGGLSFSKDFIIEIDTTNHLPTDIILSNTTVPDTNIVGTTVGKLFTLDSDTNDSHSYTLEDSQGRFKIVGDELQVVAELWGAPPLYPITITSTDASGESLSKGFILDIYENQPPTDIMLSGETVDKNSVSDAWVGTLSTVDLNEDDEHSYVLDDDAGGRFKVVDNELRIGDWVDFESGTDYFITVTSTDQGGLSFSKEFTLQVCDGAHAVYTIEDRRLHLPFIDMPIFDSETKQPTGEVKVLKGDLAFLTGIEDFQGTPENMEVLETVSTVSPCHALYQDGTLYIPYTDVPLILVLPEDVVIEGPTQIFEITLEQQPEDPSWFHLKSYQLRQ